MAKFNTKLLKSISIKIELCPVVNFRPTSSYYHAAGVMPKIYYWAVEK